MTGLPQRQLLEVARLLGLTTVSRLKKELLVERLWKAWSELLAGSGAEASPVNGSGPKAGKEAGQKVEAEPKAAGQAIAPVAHKFELRQLGTGTGGAAEPSKDIPWGYGRDRVTAMAVDPDRLFVYWEVTEEALERARKTLGAAGVDAWLNLRLYDTTGRIFDGWNAHSTLDQGLDRAARQWFFTIGKPSSETIVEIGLLTRDGTFAKIARSGRVEFPRKEPVAWSEPEWLTVRLTNGQVRRAWLAKPGRPGDTAPADGGPTSGGVVVPLPVALPPPEMTELTETIVQVGPESETVVHRSAWHSEWEEVKTEGVVTGEGRLTWEEQSHITSWSEGPFPHPVEVPEPVREASVGRTRVFRSGAKTHVVYGPWQVVIHGLGATRSRSVISRWEVYRSWGEEAGRQIVHIGEGDGVNGLGASEHLMRGASERAWRGGSELRLGGSSELYFIGASELRLAGASERLYLGASERMGASERRLGGEAVWSHAGGSEGRLGGASDYLQKPLPVSSDYPRPAGGPPQQSNDVEPNG